MAYTVKIVDNPADTTFNQILAINNEGQMAGYFGSGQPGHPNQGYVATIQPGGASFTSENYPSSAQTQVTGINDSGTTVGFEVDAAGNSYGFVDQGGVYSIAVDPLAPSLAGVFNEQFLGVNDHGQVAGFYQSDAAGDDAAFIYNSNTGAFRSITVAGASSVVATDLNNNGTVTGFFTENGTTEGFYDLGGVVHAITHAGWSDIQALGINDAGLIVGSYVDGASGDTDGFTYSRATGVFTSISEQGSAQTVINGVNDVGQLVGFYVDAAGNTDGLLLNPSPPATPPTQRATTIDNPADLTFNQLLSINDAGQIAGYFGSGAAGHPNQGYVVDNRDRFISENYPLSTQTQVTGINNSGATVGFEVDSAGDSVGFFHQGATWSLALDPNAPTINGVVTEQLLGVNDRNQAVGFYVDDASGDAASFIYNDKTGNFSALSLTPPGGGSVTSVTATDINDKGEISGFYTVNGVSEGFIDEHGHVVNITGTTGDTNVQVLGINNHGLAVGSFQNSGGGTEGFLYSLVNGDFTAYSAPHGVGGTVLNGVNDRGQIVGFYTDGASNVHGLLLTHGA